MGQQWRIKIKRSPSEITTKLQQANDQKYGTVYYTSNPRPGVTTAIAADGTSSCSALQVRKHARTLTFGVASCTRPKNIDTN